MIQKMRSLCTALIVTGLLASPVYGQGTVMAIPLAQWFDNFGAPLNGGGLCVFAAGTNTLASTYTTAALSVANTNPILMNSAGRPTSGGVFLRPGTSYKFVLKSSSVTTCVPDTGTTIWSVDNVEAVPGSASAVDVSGTAGESISAGDAVFLSTGAGSLNSGQWYKTDSDLTYKSTYAAMVGVAPNAVTSGETGSFRIAGSVTTTGLSAGSAYFAGATPGALVATPPTNAIRIGQASSSTVLIVGEQTAPVGPRGPPCGRLTLTSNTPVTTADVTAATTVYYAPYGGCNTASTFDGVQWNETAFAQLSIAVPATTATMYDVFVYDNAGVLALELTAWTNDTTRATALTTQNSVYVKTGALTRLYLGSFRTTGVSGQTEDSATKRFVWNYYNRAPRLLKRIETTASWPYTSTWRQANGSAANQVEVVIGVSETPVVVTLSASASNTDVNVVFNSGIGLDSTTVNSGNGGLSYDFAVNNVVSMICTYSGFPGIGKHSLVWLEQSTAIGTTTWIGTQNEANSGLFGHVDG